MPGRVRLWVPACNARNTLWRQGCVFFHDPNSKVVLCCIVVTSDSVKAWACLQTDSFFLFLLPPIMFDAGFNLETRACAPANLTAACQVVHVACTSLKW